MFRSEFGLPPCTTENGCFQKVDQTGGTDYPPDEQGWALESALDLDAVSAACPSCHILLVEGDDNGLDNLGIAVDTAVAQGAKFVSNSYGVPGETPVQTGLDHYYDHPGVAVTVSSGDIGNVQSWPATNPTVVGVGGTTLTRDDSERGWTETVWSDAGSGCSLFEAKPDYQEDVDTNCDNRASADVSADADPATGLAVYDSLGVNGQTGWFQVGGTSLSSPLVAAMYALAGDPEPGTYPVTYPYDNPDKANTLNDVTDGTNGGCGNVLCEAGPGWDGPTGLGTPDGVDSLTTSPRGDITGTVTDAGTGDPIENATVATDQGQSVTTDADGDYDVAVPPGRYDVTAAAFGYASESEPDVTVDQGENVDVDFALPAVASRTVHGVVSDASGQGWPLYAKITVAGVPGAVYSDPFTGSYSIDLPENASYTMHVSAAQLPGYLTQDVQVDVGDSDQTRNVALPVDQGTCAAPGYHFDYIQAGLAEEFTGWNGTTPQDGWSIVDNEGNGQTWTFDNEGNRTPPVDSDGDLAGIDSIHYGPGNSQDSSLASASYDLSATNAPVVQFDTTYYSTWLLGEYADVDYSSDGGQTWTNAWHHATEEALGHVVVPIGGAAGHADVRIRFHYSATWGFFWLVDNVSISDRSCVPTQGGLVTGFVHDGNTGHPVIRAEVTGDEDPEQSAMTMATPDDAMLGDGFYWLFSSLTGAHPFTAAKHRYVSDTRTVDVAAGFVTRQDFVLRAGHLSVLNGPVEKTEEMGSLPKSQVVRFRNDGSEPAHVTLAQQDVGFTPMSGRRRNGAPEQRIRLDGGAPIGAMTVPANRGRIAKTDTAVGADMRGPGPFDAPWQDIADYPTAIVSNAVARAEDGKIYSVAGYSGGTEDVSSGYVYAPSAGTWSQIADLPIQAEEMRAAFVDGTLYLSGGWVQDNVSSATYAYDPGADSWSRVADKPTPVAAAGVATLYGQVYLVGGCTSDQCTPSTAAVDRYDPASDSWTTLAAYPEPLAYPSCAGIGGHVVCASGVDASSRTSVRSAYSYDPDSDTWTPISDIPTDLWGSAVSNSGGKMQVATGITDNGTVATNIGFEYDPVTDEWTDLPNANNAVFRSGGACGLYQIGGITPPPSGVVYPFAEVLPGYDDCGAGGADVPWLSENKTEFDVAPGEAVKVRVTIDNSMLDQPGDYAAALAVSTDTPYSVRPVHVLLHLNPPRTWGKISGTVTDAGSGSPLAGATVRVNTLGGSGSYHVTLKTDADGYYQYWLDDRYNPLQLVVAMDGYVPKIRNARIHRHENTIVNIALSPTD